MQILQYSVHPFFKKKLKLESTKVEKDCVISKICMNFLKILIRF